jgi:RimJ/RimL family protein N-acetyltransferase
MTVVGYFRIEQRTVMHSSATLHHSLKRIESIMPILFPKNGDGFVLREFTLSDAEALATIEFDAEVKHYLALPKKERKQWIHAFDPDSYPAWAVDVGGILAGRTSISRGKRKGDREFGIVIGRPFWGTGLGKKVAALVIPMAFDEINARALVAVVHPENRASIALLRAFKFRRRGIYAAPESSWQEGHFTYRMSRSAYDRLSDKSLDLPI